VDVRGLDPNPVQALPYGSKIISSADKCSSEIGEEDHVVCLAMFCTIRLIIPRLLYESVNEDTTIARARYLGVSWFLIRPSIGQAVAIAKYLAHTVVCLGGEVKESVWELPQSCVNTTSIPHRTTIGKPAFEGFLEFWAIYPESFEPKYH
jgi:hypothetical protein